jgi:enoyl-[acyl-carrier-protein] reductase (NADH)
MKNNYCLIKKTVLRQFWLLILGLSAVQLLAQQTIVFKNPEDKTVEKLKFNKVNGLLSTKVNFQNNSNFKKDGSNKQKWHFNTEIFTIRRDDNDYTTEGFIAFNDSHEDFEISFKPDFSKNEIQRLRFFVIDKNKREFVYDAICKYPYLKLREGKEQYKVTLNNKNDSVSTIQIKVNNIGYAKLNLVVKSEQNNILSVDTTYTIPPGKLKNIAFTFKNPKTENQEAYAKNDTIHKKVKVEFINKDFPENKISKEFEVRILEIKESSTIRYTDYWYYFLWFIPLILVRIYLYYYNTFFAYKNRVDKFYDTYNNETIELFNDKNVNKFIPKKERFPHRISTYYLEKAIAYSKNNLLKADAAKLFAGIKEDHIKERLKNLLKDLKEDHSETEITEVDLTQNEHFELILKNFLNESLKTISNNLFNNELNQNLVNINIIKSVNEITKYIDQENKEQKSISNLIEEVKEAYSLQDKEYAITLLKNIYKICNDFNGGEIIRNLKNGKSVEDSLEILGKDAILIDNIKEKLNYFNYKHKGVDELVDDLKRENKQLNSQISTVSNEKMLWIVLENTFKIIDSIENHPNWNQTFKDVFFRALKDKNSSIRKELAKKKNHPIDTYNIDFNILEYTLSELFRIYAFSKVELNFVKNNFNAVSFPLSEYESNMLILKGLILKIYGFKIVIPKLFNTKFNSEIHKKGEGVSEVMRSAPSQLFNDIKDQTIIDFEKVVFKTTTSAPNEKIRVFTR